jgi:hypothetical protein
VRKTVEYNSANRNLERREAEAAVDLGKAGFDENGASQLDLRLQKDILTTLMRRRAEEYENIFGDPEILAEMEERSDKHFIEDMYALKWHSAQPLKDPYSGNIDYRTRDLERAHILAEAIEKIEADPAAMGRLGALAGSLPGVDEVTAEQYITGRGVGTFVGVQWENQVVANAMTAYRGTMDGIRDTRFHESTKDDSWNRVMADFPDLEDQMRFFAETYEARRGGDINIPPWQDSYAFWFEEQLRVLLPGMRKNPRYANATEGFIRAEARKIVSTLGGEDGIPQSYSRLKNSAELNWIYANPDLAQDAAAYGLITLTRAEVDAILLGLDPSASAQTQARPTMSLAGSRS